MKDHGQRRDDFLHLAVIAAAALAIGTYLIVTCVVITPDGVFYINQAQALAHNPWTVAGQFPPGYPLLLLGAYRLVSAFVPSDSVLLWVYSSQAVTLLCRVLALACLYFLGKRLTDARRSFWAVLILTFLPYPADYGSLVLREWPFLLFLALGLWLLLWAVDGRRWWGFALVGLVAGLGYLIRPECAQLLVYGFVGLAVCVGRRQMPRSRALPAALALLVSFLVPATPYLLASGTLVPHQMRPSVINRPPVITSLANQSASHQPLEFDVSVGELLELPIIASDPDGDPVTLSVAVAPWGSRPVYRFVTATGTGSFLTLSEAEKDQVLTAYGPGTYTYDGIAFYAWPGPNGPAGLAPVHRFWSSVGARHFYTTREADIHALPEETEGHPWQAEGVAFYAFAPGREPPDAEPVYEFRTAAGAPYWAFDRSEASAQPLTETGEVAWYAYGPGEAPPGLTVEAGTVKWRPGPDQQGRHQLNLIADDGQVQSCQLVRIRVHAQAAGAPRGTMALATLTAIVPSARLATAWEALYEIGTGFLVNVMYFLIVPLGLGLYRYLKDEAGPCERALTVAIVAVNIGLIFARYVWVEPGPTRRYCLALAALAMFHVPKGGEIMAHWIKVGVDIAGWRRISRRLSERSWFYLLVALALGPMSLPKLLTPPGIDKIGYRQVAYWLKANTDATDVIAVPDVRISFYAEREGLKYDRHPDPRRAGYVVAVVTDPSALPNDWREVYSQWVNKRQRARLIVYEIPSEKRLIRFSRPLMAIGDSVPKPLRFVALSQ